MQKLDTNSGLTDQSVPWVMTHMELDGQHATGNQHFIDILIIALLTF